VAVRHLGFVWDIFWPPTVSTWGLYHSAKFGYDRCSRFYNMNISIFGTFSRPKNCFLGHFDALNGLQYQPKPKKAHPCVSLHHLSRHGHCRRRRRCRQRRRWLRRLWCCCCGRWPYAYDMSNYTYRLLITSLRLTSCYELFSFCIEIGMDLTVFSPYRKRLYGE